MRSILWFVDEYPEAATALATMSLLACWVTAGIASMTDAPIAALLVTIPSAAVFHRAGSRWIDE